MQEGISQHAPATFLVVETVVVVVPYTGEPPALNIKNMAYSSSLLKFITTLPSVHINCRKTEANIL